MPSRHSARILSLALALACAGRNPSGAQATSSPPPTETTTPPPETSPDPARIGPGRIQGKVVTRDAKNPSRGAVVRAYHLRTNEIFASAPTGPDGQFIIDNLPYGYVDLSVETPDGVFVANQVVNVPPGGKAAVSFTLSRTDQIPGGWWSGRASDQLPGEDRPTIGVAEIAQKPKGAEFWKSGKGVAILAGAGGVALLAIAAGGGDDSPASPSTP